MASILITGATGQLGQEVVKSLLSRTEASNIAAMVRNPEKEEAVDIAGRGVELRKADYGDYESLVKAFQGISKLYFVSGSDIPHRLPQHENVVKAAVEAGVGHVVYTSFERINETETSPIAMVAEAHIKTEAWLKSSGITYTILKQNLYLDMLPMYLGEKVMETGVIYLPAGNGKTGFVSRKDMANLAAEILTSKGHENKSYDVTAEKAYSFAEVAEELSGITGKSIQYVSPSLEEYNNTLTKAGVPAQFIALFAGFAQGIAQGEFEQTSDIIFRVTGKHPVSVPEFLQQVYKG